MLTASDDAPQPLYRRIKVAILSRIESGELAPGDRVPSEAEIVKEHGASRMTVNRAIRELSAEGRLVRVQGLGTFVAKPRPRAALFEIHDIAVEIAQRGGVHSGQIVRKSLETADTELAAALEIAPDAQVFHIVLVHNENGTPLQIEDRYVNPAAAPHFMEQDYTRMTPSRYLLASLPVTEIEHMIEARRPTRQEARLLNIANDEACLSLLRRSWARKLVVTRVRLVSPGALFSLGGRFSTLASS